MHSLNVRCMSILSIRTIAVDAISCVAGLARACKASWIVRAFGVRITVVVIVRTTFVYICLM